jgi:hypothetical protein
MDLGGGGVLTCGMCLFGSERDPVEGCFDNNNECSGYVKGLVTLS